MEDEKPPLHQIAEELQMTVGLLVRQLRAASAEGGVTLSQTSVLKRLKRDGVHTATELARAERVRPQSVMATVNALQADGYVERTAHPTDGRRQLISLTDKGRTFLAHREGVGHDLLVQRLTECLTPAQLDVLAQALPVLRRLAED
ncbi:MarR family winged helix-turn-helix transcriptional regulator [Streptomyces sp. NBC_01264]|uniref:MarR family winged helix-turn-helix transcriptional regulator n=1 Tax=Streptomyces sp. NBC_01264 TaxID=2903804 RepID=UPI0022505202|nr:MarR family transcriptional regulator [Streptomyces sp. NBC_01264]MCX4781945.1 MarR family transcriptional regulator [Streptomyces sp. NBC_01264]